jgi:hypothetical protein
MKKTEWNSRYFYGIEITEEEIQNGYINYRTLATAFDAVLCNDITKLFFTEINGVHQEAELYNGTDYNEEDDYYYDIFQYYIIDNNGVSILEDNTDEIIYYLPELDIYVWGVTHYGTPWNGVNTNIKIKLEVEQ